MSKRHKKKKNHEEGAERVDDATATHEADARAEEESETEEPTNAPPSADGDGDGDGDTDAIRAENERLVEEAAGLKDLAQRKQAEFENFRRRIERERTDFVRHATADLVLEILPVFDNLGRAVDAAEKGSEDQLREGVAIIYRQFKDILERNGLEEIECEGKPFDPHIHEAVSRVQTNAHPDGTVIEVFQKGYRLKERLLRPSMVSVAQRDDEAASSETSGDSSSGSEEEDEVLRHSE